MAFGSHACVARAAPRVRRRPPDLGGQDPVRHTRAPKNTHEATVISAHMYFGNDPTIIPDPTRPTRRPNHSTHQPPPIDTLFKLGGLVFPRCSQLVCWARPGSNQKEGHRVVACSHLCLRRSSPTPFLRIMQKPWDPQLHLGNTGLPMPAIDKSKPNTQAGNIGSRLPVALLDLHQVFIFAWSPHLGT
jgi:hypothetical protein